MRPHPDPRPHPGPGDPDGFLAAWGRLGEHVAALREEVRAARHAYEEAGRPYGDDEEAFARWFAERGPCGSEVGEQRRRPD